MLENNADFGASGGITSNDVAVRSLGVRCAEVIGAVVPGVPAWRCGPETKAPGLAYVVFPGSRSIAKVVDPAGGVWKLNELGGSQTINNSRH